MADIYTCTTAYHFLITLVKRLVYKKPMKLVLCTHQDISDEMIERIRKSNLFEGVEVYKEIDELDATLDYSAPYFKRHGDLQRQLDAIVPWKYCKEDNYYLYNDITIMGKWLNSHRIPYYLMEDGLDNYTLPAFKSLNYVESSFKKKCRKLFDAGFYCFGESKYMKSLEVNSLDGLLIKSKKIFVAPRSELFGKLSNDDKQIIMKIFLDESELLWIQEHLCVNEDATLLLTQPLAADGMTSEKTHERFYADIVERYCTGKLIIKPHPRDGFDYKTLFPDAIVIDVRTLPAEIMGFIAGVSINKCVTWCSTAINNISYCNEKISLGIDFIKPYILADEGFESKWGYAKNLKA